ncbi:TPA: hypothetical protein U2D27_000334 [Streptococcus suis]|nr:hypothetical protein [Streptococcus suis]HEM6362358.1 hypothetical protein [Streptococcus suis]HEM6403444.1 hypothetical protein [Streptococcus suis]
MSKYNTHPATSLGNWKMKNVHTSKEKNRHFVTDDQEQRRLANKLRKKRGKKEMTNFQTYLGYGQPYRMADEHIWKDRRPTLEHIKEQQQLKKLKKKRKRGK